MCFVTKNTTPKVAKRNILVYKVVRKSGETPGSYVSEYRSYFYLPGELQPQVIPLTHYWKTLSKNSEVIYEYSEGYHSYSKGLYPVVRGLVEDKYTTVLCIIPKGTDYLEGFFYNPEQERNHLSSQIVVLGSVWNPLNWLKALIWKP